MHTNRISAPERILAIRLDNIGDIVMLSPALRALRAGYPSAHITLMASPAGSQVAPLLPWIDDVITWRAVWQDIGKEVPLEPEKEAALVTLLNKNQFEAAFIFTSFSQSPYPPAYACYLARIPMRVGQSNEFGGGLLSHWIKPLPDITYQVERNLHLLREVGIPAANDQMELQTGREERASVQALISAAGIGGGEPFLVLAPGASAVSRLYNESRFEQVALQFIRKTGLPLVLTGSPRERGKFPRLESLAELHPMVHSFIGQTSVAESAEIIRRSAIVICNNSGSLHIAAAFNRPIVVLFSGTEWMEQWLPRSANLHVLNRPTECTPCREFQCRYNMECLDIPAEEVTAAAVALLEQEVPYGSGIRLIPTGEAKRENTP
jgi:ADP-heptose:LPS heptosyltransferase